MRCYVHVRAAQQGNEVSGWSERIVTIRNGQWRTWRLAVPDAALASAAGHERRSSRSTIKTRVSLIVVTLTCVERRRCKPVHGLAATVHAALPNHMQISSSSLQDHIQITSRSHPSSQSDRVVELIPEIGRASCRERV